jgi:DegV family protein with EDD domain
VAAYRQCLSAGADRLVSIHLSAELSSTADAARLAASQVGEHLVSVVDSRSTAMGMGFAVMAAARAAVEGADAATVVDVARDTAAATRTFFVVDTLEHLRRGGRIGSAAALLGTALSVKPVLHVREGRVVPLEKVRTTARAVNRLVQLAVGVADGPVALAVHHLAAPERAERLAAELRQQVPELAELYVSELGAAIGAHVGPGAVGVVIAPSPPQLTEPDLGSS